MPNNVTRRSVLEEALRYRQTVMQQSSEYGMGLRARKGMEETFDRYAEECRILRELIQALEYEPVRAAIAEFLGKEEPEVFTSVHIPIEGENKVMEWQIRIMDGEKQTELFHDHDGMRYLEMVQDGHKAENDADH